MRSNERKRNCHPKKIFSIKLRQFAPIIVIVSASNVFLLLIVEVNEKFSEIRLYSGKLFPNIFFFENSLDSDQQTKELVSHCS